jgi:hypothetical protein
MSDEIPSSDYKSMKAEAKAAKAAAKAVRPWYKKKRFIIPIGFFLLIAGATSTGGGSSDDTVSPNEQSTPAATEDSQENQEFDGAIGSKVADGKFTFVVEGYECGIKEVGNEFLSQKAQGEYCVIQVKVTNTGDEAQYMFADNQYLYDQKGRQFSADTTANIYSGDSGDVWMTEINPGNSVKGYIFFDVPKGTKLSYLELHDSAFSGGVTVQL